MLSKLRGSHFGLVPVAVVVILAGSVAGAGTASAGRMPARHHHSTEGTVASVNGVATAGTCGSSPGNVGRAEGVTIQEVLRALIDRAEYVNRQTPCAETGETIALMTAAVQRMEARAARLHGREAPSAEECVRGSACDRCGHVGCNTNRHA